MIVTNKNCQKRCLSAFLLTLTIALAATFACNASALTTSQDAKEVESFVVDGGQARAVDHKVEARSGRIFGKARVKADGSIAFQLTPSVGVFRKEAVSFEVIVPAAAAIMLFRDAEDFKGETITAAKALEYLNGNPSLVALSGHYDANTNTFMANNALDIVG